MTTRARTVNVKDTAFGQDMLEVLAERQLENTAYHGLAISQSIVTLKEHLVKKLSHGKWKIDPGLSIHEKYSFFSILWTDFLYVLKARYVLPKH